MVAGMISCRIHGCVQSIARLPTPRLATAQWNFYIMFLTRGNFLMLPNVFPTVALDVTFE
jgi:hypothetical protein